MQILLLADIHLRVVHVASNLCLPDSFVGLCPRVRPSIGAFWQRLNVGDVVALRRHKLLWRSDVHQITCFQCHVVKCVCVPVINFALQKRVSLLYGDTQLARRKVFAQGTATLVHLLSVSANALAADTLVEAL